jgi:uncharacterized protein YjcR
MLALEDRQQEVKEKARHLYLVEKGVHLPYLAKRLGVSVDEIRQWHQEGNWLNERRELQEKERAERRKVSAKAEEVLIELLSTAKTVSNTIRDQLVIRYGKKERAVCHSEIRELVAEVLEDERIGRRRYGSKYRTKDDSVKTETYVSHEASLKDLVAAYKGTCEKVLMVYQATSNE